MRDVGAVRAFLNVLLVLALSGAGLLHPGLVGRAEAGYRLAGTLGGVGRGEEQFLHARSIVRGSDRGYWVVDTGNDRIQRLDDRLSFRFAFGASGFDPSGFLNPTEGLRFDEPFDLTESVFRELYIVDRNNSRVVHTDRDGVYIDSFGMREGLEQPGGIASTSLGDVVVCDTGNDRIVFFDRDGRFLRTFGTYGWGPLQFRFPEDVVVDEDDRILVADTGNSRIQIFDYFGRPQGIIGGLDRPRGIDLAPEGRLWVADPGLGTVRLLDSQGRVHADLARELDRSLEDVFGVLAVPGGLLLMETAQSRILLVEHH